MDNKLTGLHVAVGSANHVFGGKIAPSTFTLEPGTYGVVRVEIQCGNSNRIIHTKSKGFLIPEYEQTIVTFDVAAGEVVNLGTLNLGKPILGKITPTNSHVGPLEDDVWLAFIEANPEIAKKMKFRPMELRSPEMPRPPTARL